MKKIKMKFDEYEFRILVNAVNDLRTSKIKEGKPVDCIDELLEKLLK